MAKPTKYDSSTLRDAADDALNRAQVLFTANPAIGPQSQHFWQVQDRFLEEVEKFSSAWFKRRHDATQSALEAVSTLSNAGMRDPGAAMQLITEWQTHSMERLAEDAKDCAEMVTHCMGTFVANEAEAVEEATQNVKRATSHKAIPV